MKKLFWNSSESRLRAGWRVLIQWLVTVIPFVILGLSGWFSNGILIELKSSVLGVTLTVSSVVIIGRFVDKRKLSDFGVYLGRKRWWLDYGIGFLAGVIGAAAYCVFMWSIGWAEIKPAVSLSGSTGNLILGILFSMLIYIGVGLFEELMRVYQVRNLAEGFHNKRISLFLAATLSVVIAAISSVIMHLSRPDPGFLTYVFITTSIYGFFYFWTGKAALAMAFHFAWDFTNSSIFALGSSASPSSPALFNVFFNSPAWSRPSLMMLLGVVGKIFGLAVVLLWLKLKDGKVKIDPGLFTPHFNKHNSDAPIEKENQGSLLEHRA